NPASARSAVQVEPVQLHHPGPGSDEILHELLLTIVAGIYLGQRAQHRVRTEYQVGAAACPAQRTLATRDALVTALAGRAPFRAHVQQIDEEIVAQGARPVGEHAIRIAV